MGHRDLYSNFIIFHMFQEVSEMACSKFICGVYPIDEVGFLNIQYLFIILKWDNLKEFVCVKCVSIF